MSSSSNWKNYGGTNHFEHANDITVNELTVDTLSLKNAYYGIFKVIGDVYTTGNVNISSNIDVSGTTSLYGNVDIANSLIVNINTHIKNKLYLGNNTTVVSDSTNPFFYASQLFTGLNTTTPTAPLDISINTECGVFFHSSNSTNKNVLTKNNTKYGIIASTTDTTSSIAFYNNSSILEPYNGLIDISGLMLGDATLNLTDGNLILSASTNVMLNTNTIFTTDLSMTEINNEFVTIYDSPSVSSVYNYNRYNDITYKFGKSLTLVGYGGESGDISAGTFLSVVNRNNLGIGIIGGSDPENITEPFSTTGLFINKKIKEHYTSLDTTLVSNNYFIPIQTAVMGTSHSHNRVSLGINNTNPARDSFLMDINGPVRITNTDFFHDLDVSFQITRVEYLCGNTNYIVAIGSPTNITDSNSTKDTILISTDGGENWKYIFDSITTTTITDKKKFDNINIYDENIILLSNPTGQLVISFSQGIKESWYNITSIGIINSIPILGFTKLTEINDEIVYILILYDSADNQFVTAFFTKNTIQGSANKSYSVELSQTNYTHALSTIITDSEINTTNGEVSITGISCKSAEYFYITTSNGIYKISFSLSTNDTIISLSTDISYNTNYTYNDVKMFNDSTYPDFAIFVGNGIISYTNDGTTFYDSDITSTNIDSYDSGNYFDIVNIYSLTVATAIGKNKTQIYYTVDGAVTWSLLSKDIMNSTGIYYGIVPKDESPLINAFISADNTLLIFGVYENYTENSNGLSKLFKGYLPQIFSSSTNTVFDICGNSNIWGNLYTQNNVDISGNVLISKVLTCDSSAVINELIVNGIASFNGTIQSYDDISCSTNTYTAGNMEVSGNGLISGNSIISGKSLILGVLTCDSSAVINELIVNGIAYFNETIQSYNDISCATNTYTTGNTSVYGNINANSNINISDSLYVTNSIYSTNTVFCLSTLDVSNNTICHSNVDICGNLTAYSDVSLSTLYVSGYTRMVGDVLIDGSLILMKTLDLDRNPLICGSFKSRSTIDSSTNITAGTNLYVMNDISINGNIYGISNSYLTGTVDISGLLTTQGNINCTHTTKTLYLDGTNSILNIGSSITNTVNICNATNKIVNISYSGSESTNDYSNTINIGSGTDMIYVRGISTIFSSSVHFTDSKIQLLDGKINYSSSKAGIYIRDNNDDNAAYMCINYNRDGVLLKSPESTNILNINTKNITLTDAKDYITGNNINTGLLVFRHTDDGSNTGTTVRTVGTVPIDASNIFIKDSALSTNTRQYISTDVTLSGFLAITGNVSVGSSGGTETMNDSSDYSSGAVVINGGVGIYGAVNTKGNISVGGIMYCNNGLNSSSYTTGSLIVTGGIGVSGEVYTSGNIIAGTIMKVNGNIESSGSSVGTLVVTGGTGISGKLFVDGNTNIGGIVKITNTTESSLISNGALIVTGGIGVSGTINASVININNGNSCNSITSGAIIVNGGVGIQGNIFIGNTVNILGNVISTDSSSGTLIVKGGVGISGNISVNEDVLVSGNIKTPTLFVERIIESIYTIYISKDDNNRVGIEYSQIPSIIYLNIDNIDTTKKITLYMNLPTYVNKIFTVNVIIPTKNYINRVFINDIEITANLKFNGGTENIFIESNDITLQSLTVIYTDDSTTPKHIISSISSYYE